MIISLKNKNLSIFFCIILFLIHFSASYPGAVSPDTLDQFNQSLVFNFSSHHPPIMAMVWSVFNYIYQGPQTMLFFHLNLKE